MEEPILDAEELREAVIDALVRRLHDVGKIQTQKLVYFLQEAYGLPLGCRFYLHHYGPYSEEVERSISNLRLMGYVRVESDPAGYGFHVTPSSSAEPGWRVVSENAQAEIDPVLERLGGMDASRLELAATIHYVRKRFKLDKPDVITSVRVRKPKFKRETISDAYDSLASMGLV